MVATIERPSTLRQAQGRPSSGQAPQPSPDDATLTEERARELGRCYASTAYFIRTYCKIYDSVVKDWIPFDLWPAQEDALAVISQNKLTVILKARQIGLTWLCLAYALWHFLFRPIAVISLFSRRDTEALYLASDERMRGMFDRLPAWMKTGHGVEVDSGHEWILSNGSAVRAFPTSAGDSYVATLAIVDEADIAPDLSKLMRAVKPTIDNGGQLILLSRADKGKPNSEFKMIYRAAKAGRNEYAHVFLPWHVHPARDATWYEAQKRDMVANTGSTDTLLEQYPATDTEALAERSHDKRIPSKWIEACYAEMEPLDLPDAPSIPGLEIFVPPDPKRAYVIGADPAEGNPGSDDSAATVVDAESGEECARLRGKIEPGIFGSYLIDLSVYYRGAGVLVERQNHGHAVILFMRENSGVRLLRGHDGKTGWMSSTLGKHLVYNEAVEVFRDGAREGVKLLHSFDTYTQLASIEGATLRAPDGMPDDLADSFAFAQAARNDGSRGKEAGTW